MSREVEELQRATRQRPLDCGIPLNISWGVHIPELDAADSSPATNGRGSACSEPNVGIPGVRDIKGVCIERPYAQSAYAAPPPSHQPRTRFGTTAPSGPRVMACD